MLCRSSVISSTLPHPPRLAGVPSLTFSAVAIQSPKDKGRGWGVCGNSTINLLCLPFECVFPCPAISHPTFCLHITNFHIVNITGLAVICMQPQRYSRSDCFLWFCSISGPFWITLKHKKCSAFKDVFLSICIPAAADRLAQHEPFSVTLAEVQ